MALWLTTRIVHQLAIWTCTDELETDDIRDAVRGQKLRGPRRRMAKFLLPVLCAALCLLSGALYIETTYRAQRYSRPLAAGHVVLITVPLFVGVLGFASLLVELLVEYRTPAALVLLMVCSCCHCCGLCPAGLAACLPASWSTRRRHAHAEALRDDADGDDGGADDDDDSAAAAGFVTVAHGGEGSAVREMDEL